VKLLVLGAGGMLGRDLVAAAERAGHEVTPLARAELDVTDAEAVEAAVGRAGPDWVANCAAYTRVDDAEREAEQAMRVNGEAAGVVARATAAAGATVLYPSTDYVFDGAKREGYVESDPVAPLSSYGRSKLAGERASAGGLVVRTSWLFGVGGRNFVETMLGLAERRKQISVVDDQVGGPTFTAHLAPALVAVMEGGVRGVRHASAGGSCSWREFAAAIFERTGAGIDLRGTTTEDFGAPAPRPHHSLLATEHADTPRLPHWSEGLDAYLAVRVPA
jgi:dTDP-4-dehydrorhamnose reductase